MDDKTAFDVEAAPIDAYPGLTNIASPLYQNKLDKAELAETILSA